MFMLLRRNSETTFSELSVLFENSLTGIEVFLFLRGLLSGITIYYLSVKNLSRSFLDLVGQSGSLSATVGFVNVTGLQNAGNQYLANHLPLV